MTPLPGLTSPAVDQLAALVAEMKLSRPRLLDECHTAAQRVVQANQRLTLIDQRIEALETLIDLCGPEAVPVEIPF